MNDPIRYSYSLLSRDAVQLAVEVAALGLPGYLDTQTQVDTALVQILFAADLTAQQKATLDAAVAAHTPDPLGPAKRLRAAAKAMLDASDDRTADLVRAVVIESLAYANAERAQFNALLAWLGGQTALTSRAQLTGFQLAQASPAQARALIEARIDNAEADL